MNVHGPQIQTPFSWCGVFFAGLTVVGIGWAFNRVRRGPTRIEVVAEEQRDGWTARLMRIGPWSADTKAWVGRSRYDLELLGPDNSVRRHRMLIFELDEALDYARRELDRAATT